MNKKLQKEIKKIKFQEDTKEEKKKDNSKKYSDKSIRLGKTFTNQKPTSYYDEKINIFYILASMFSKLTDKSHKSYITYK